jgi:hypothetical protein
MEFSLTLLRTVEHCQRLLFPVAEVVRSTMDVIDPG